MKHIGKISALAIGLLACSACSDIDDMKPSGTFISNEDVEKTTAAIAERVAADLSGMYSYMGKQYAGLPSNERDDDFGYPTAAISADCNGSDMVCANSGFNWFSPASDYGDRQPNYANPCIRYAIFYNQIEMANSLIKSIDIENASQELLYYVAQAKAVRAFDYLNLAPYFQFSYQQAKDLPCVPLVTETTTDYANNPRASVEKVYEQIVGDLTDAISELDGFTRSNKTQIDRQVAYGLRARAYLAMGLYAEAAADAEQALQGYEPASMQEVGTPFLFDLKEHNWMWGILIEAANLQNGNGGYPTWTSHLCSLTALGYATEVGCYKRINTLLYDKIPATDVRKGWWVDENLDSPLLNTVSWNGHTGRDLALYAYDNKMAYEPYTNVKFGVKSGVGSDIDDNDWCLMRAEEMVLIKAEAVGMAGNLAEGKRLLEDFVKTYRDPSYTCTAATAEAFQNECWKQRRVELWGEGFSIYDISRLNKPVVRIHDGDYGNWPDGFAFNIPANDGYRLMRFSQSETNTNSGIVNNSGGTAPSPGQYGELRDGVTD